MTTRLGRPALLREFNERAVFEAVRAGHPISRAELARRLGLSKPTVSAALGNLLDAGLVREAETEPGARTYGATFYRPSAEAAHVFALDIGGRYLRAALAALDGTVVAREDVEIAGARVVDVIAQALRLRDRLLRRAGLAPTDVEAAVVGVPGVVDRTGRVRLSDSVADLEGARLGEQLAAALGLTVLVENDVNLATLAEHHYGAARDVEDFAFLSIGTGTGAGLVLRGELHRGANGLAGEVDFAIDRDTGGDRPCGAHPHDPCVASFTWQAEEWIAEQRPAETTTVLAAPTTPEAIFSAARAGDLLGLRLVAEEARRIAVYAAPIAAVVDVDLIVLGGDIGLNGDLLLEPVRTELARRHPYPPRVTTSELADHAVLDGAIVLGIQTTLEIVLLRHLRR